MKIRSDQEVIEPLPLMVQQQLEEFRLQRGFDPAEWVQKKQTLLRSYCQQYSLDRILVGVSGGVDSAVVLALCASLSDSIETVPVLLPAFDFSGVTGQENSVEQATNLCQAMELTPTIINMTPIADSFISAFSNNGTRANPSDWAIGQLVPYARTTALYYLATLGADEGKRTVIGGTTNWSEGGYLGYIGKASDAMVDLQLVSDLHKSEVYEVARYFNLPAQIVSANPTGDMFDGSSDEQVFGASYDFVEWYLTYLSFSPVQQADLLSSLSEEDVEYVKNYGNNLDKLHLYNKHKYLAASPAIHLDVMPLHTYEGFWKTQQWQPQSSQKKG